MFVIPNEEPCQRVALGFIPGDDPLKGAPDRAKISRPVRAASFPVSAAERPGLVAPTHRFRVRINGRAHLGRSAATAPPAHKRHWLLAARRAGPAVPQERLPHSRLTA